MMDKVSFLPIKAKWLSFQTGIFSMVYLDLATLE
jgi:hypothetical protein